MNEKNNKSIESFTYLGHTFSPIRKFKGREASSPKLIRRLHRMGINNYEGGKYNYDDFYKAASKKVDIYLMDGETIVIPCENELFKYIKD